MPHIYGIVAGGTKVPSGLKGLCGEKVRCVERDGLAALVSTVPDDLQVGRDELLAHAGVLEHTIAASTVLPMRFGVVVQDEEAVRDGALGAENGHHHQLIDKFDQLVQLTVKAYHREDVALREVLRNAPDLVRARERVATMPDDASYYERIRLGEQVSAGLEQLRAEDASGILDRLAPLATAVADEECHSMHQVLNAAFLVRRDDRKRFDKAVSALADFQPDRLHLRYLGPQPPYAFVDMAASEPAWA